MPERRSVALSGIAGKVPVYGISWGKWWSLERSLHVPLRSTAWLMIQRLLQLLRALAQNKVMALRSALPSM